MVFDRAKLQNELASLAGKGVFIGTSSWKYSGWRGMLYDEQRYVYRGKFAESRFEKNCLTEYAEVFNTVCVDAGYSPLQSFRKRIVDIPISGSITAGFADKREQEASGCVSIDIGTLNIKPSARTFALEVRGDSMIGRHIVDGDVVVVEHGQTPRNGDVVAALIDGESTLKTFVSNNGKPHLKAENSKYPNLIPAGELVIQGVMVALIRKRK